MSEQPRTIDTGGGDDPALRTLLELGRMQATRPTTTLRARVLQPDGADWLVRVLANDFDGSPIDAAAVLCSAEGEIEFLRRQYLLAKKCFHGATSEDDRLHGLLWYLLVQAAAAVYHDVKLTSQPVETLAGALLDVAPDLPDPWGDLTAHAALALRSTD